MDILILLELSDYFNNISELSQVERKIMYELKVSEEMNWGRLKMKMNGRIFSHFIGIAILARIELALNVLALYVLFHIASMIVHIIDFN